MKRLLLIIVVVMYGQFSYGQGELKLGLNGGFPVGDSSSFTDLNWGLDAAYLMDVAGIFQGGPLMGYTNFLRGGDQRDLDFLPIAASGRVDLPVLMAGLDLGFAIGLGGGVGSGFFYRPKVGMEFSFFDIIASYSAVSAIEGHFSSVNLGIELTF